MEIIKWKFCKSLIQGLFLLRMLQNDVYFGVFLTDVSGGLLGEEDGAVLPAGASETDHQVVEMTFQVVVD